jgi:N-methylhydantoinase B
VSAQVAGSRADALDPVTFELLHASLVSAADEMGQVIKRSSHSPIIREMDDFSCAIFRADGALVAQADFIPAQLGAMSLVVQSLISRWAGRVGEGDVFLANHPYLGGMHAPDLNVIMPVFIEGALFAWAGTTAHHIDVGGVRAGSQGSDLEQLFAEGLVFAGVRLYVAGQENSDIVSVLTENVRDPVSTLSDLRAQRAACLLGRRRVEEAVARFGRPTVRAGLSQMLDVVDRATRLSLAELADGEAEAEGYLDDDGFGGPPVRLHARMRKTGDRLEIDLSGSAAQVRGALNVPWASTRAAVAYLVRAMTDPGLTTNDGILRSLSIVCPPGSVLNPRPPGAVSVRHNTCQRLADTLVRCASQLWPAKAVASSTVTFFGMHLEGISPLTGRLSVMAEVVGGGTGAHRRGDGLDGVDTYMGNVGLMPVEVAETSYSVRILRTSLVPGSQGLGTYNGGLGLRREYLITGDAKTVTLYAEQTDPAFRPAGAHGGGDGAPSVVTVTAPDGTVLPLGSKFTRRLEPGSVICVETAGGGGYGDPRGRAAVTREADAADGMTGAQESSGPAGGARNSAEEQM